MAGPGYRLPVVVSGGGGGVAAPTKLFNQSYENKQFSGQQFVMNTSVPIGNTVRAWNGNCVEPSTGIFFACDGQDWTQFGGAGSGAGCLLEMTPAGVATEFDIGTLYSMQAECIAYSAVDGCFYLVGYDKLSGNTYIYSITGPSGSRVFTLQLTLPGWHGIAITINQSSGDIWVSDWSSNNLHLFHSVGGVISEDASSPIALIGMPSNPTHCFDVCVDNNGDCWIATNFTTSIFRVDIATLTSQQFSLMNPITNIVVCPNSLPLTITPPTRFAYDSANDLMYFTGRCNSPLATYVVTFKPSDYSWLIGPGPTTPLYNMEFTTLTSVFLNNYAGGIAVHPLTGSLYMTNANGALSSANIVCMRAMTPFALSSNFVSNLQPPFAAPWGDELFRYYNPTYVMKCVFSNVSGTVRLWWADWNQLPSVEGGLGDMGNFVDSTVIWETLIAPTSGKKIRVRNCNLQVSTPSNAGFVYLKFATSGIDITQYGTNKSAGPVLEGQYIEGAVNEPVSIQSMYYCIMTSIQLAYDEA